MLGFQSTLPARGATRRCSPGADTSDDFNPRSPHGERHNRAAQHQQKCNLISIHAPRTGSDFFDHRFDYFTRYFNPRSPHGERLYRRDLTLDKAPISIHAPRTGSDDGVHRVLILLTISIHAPRTGSDATLTLVWPGEAISIHAPRTGSDGAGLSGRARIHPISIHAPRTGSDDG